MIITTTTKKYKDLSDQLVESIPEGHEVRLYTHPMEKEAVFGTKEFREICFFKFNCVLNAMIETEDESILMYIDGDVKLLTDPSYFISQLRDEDMKFQREADDTACAGFFVVRVTPETKQFLVDVMQYKDRLPNDQLALNLLLPGSKIKYSYFSDSDVYSYGLASGGKVWKGEDFGLPEDMKAFHANYCIGIEDKKKLLDKI